MPKHPKLNVKYRSTRSELGNSWKFGYLGRWALGVTCSSLLSPKGCPSPNLRVFPSTYLITLHCCILLKESRKFGIIATKCSSALFNVCCMYAIVSYLFNFFMKTFLSHLSSWFTVASAWFQSSSFCIVPKKVLERALNYIIHFLI